MYKIHYDEQVNNEPWNISLTERFKILMSAKLQGKKIAAMIYRSPDTSTFRYRCYNVMQATKYSNCWQSVYFFANEIEFVKKNLASFDILIFTRLKWIHEAEELAVLAREKNIPILFDVDDLVCDLGQFKLVTNTLNIHFNDEASYDIWFAYLSRYEQSSYLADGFITTNDYLGKKLNEKFGKPYQIISNFLNSEQVQVSEACVRQKLESIQPFTIGYFSGTPTHINDFKVVSEELAQLLYDYPDIKLQVVGFMEFPETMKQLISREQIIFSPFVDFIELQRLIAQVDVNIAPLVQNDFTNCKSELKFFEAAAVNTTTIASPTYSFAHAIEENKTGFLCEPGQWYEKIAYLFEASDVNIRIAENSREYCLKRYYGENVVRQINSAYNYYRK